MLEDVTVVELGSRVSTGYCGRLLADAGATVIRLESAGDEPPLNTDPASAAYRCYLHAGKRSVTVAADGCGDLLAAGVPGLAGRAVVVVCDDADPAVSRRITELRANNPGLTMVTVSDYGRNGPAASLPASEFTLQAEAGITALHPTGDRPPVATSVELAEVSSGICAALGAVIGLLSAEAGEGEGGACEGIDVDVSRFEALVGLLQFPWLFSQLTPHSPYPIPQNAVPGVERAGDGWVCVVAVSAQQWAAFKKMAGVPELDDPRFDAYGDRIRLGAEVTPLVRRFTERHTIAELVEMGVAARVPVVPVCTPASVAELPPYTQRGAYVDHGAGFIQPAPPFRITGAANHARASGGRVAASADPSAPLRGLRVLEFGAFQAGPMTTAHLAGLGAEVIKIEAVSRPDVLRFTGNPTTVDRMWERSGSFLGANLGKRDVTLDLSDPQGLELAKRLITTADVVLENFTPRVLDERGLDYPGIRRLRPDIVMVRMPAWGLTGTWRDRPGFAFTAEAAAGLTAMSGYPDGEPLLTGSITDPTAALVASFATLAAIRRRRDTGRGMCVEVSLCDVAAQLTARPVIEESATGAPRTRTGNRSPHAAPQGMYRCANDTWIAVSVATDEQWAALAALPGLPWWAVDDRLATLAGRRTHHDELDRGLARLCAMMSSQEIAALLRKIGVPAASLAIGTDFVDHPQLRHRDRVFTVDHPVAGTVRHIGLPMRFSPALRTPVTRPAPLFGQDNHAVLTELGCAADAIQALADAGLLADAPYRLPYAH